MSQFFRPWIAALVVLGGVSAERLRSAPPRSAVEYHRRVREAAAQFPPLEFGQWVGKDQEVEKASIKMLRPNVIISRRYHNLSSGIDVGFLFVQCPDTIAIMDHYPPVCYVNQGYRKDVADPHDWVVNGQDYTGTEYGFSMQSFTHSSALLIENFIVLPDGSVARNMDAVRVLAGDRHRRFLGAAQCQLVFDPSTSAEERDAAFGDLIAASQPLIEVVRQGEK